MRKSLSILYIAAIRLPTEKAHGVQIMRTCEALEGAGAQVELVVPGRKTEIKENAFSYYKVKDLFKLTIIQIPDWFGMGRLGFFISSFWFGIVAARYAKKKGVSVIYSRDKLVLYAASLLVFDIPLVWEVHGRESGFGVGRLIRRSRIVVITKAIKDDFEARGVPGSQITVAPDGVDLSIFEHVESSDKARARLGLTLGGIIVMYIGRLDGWKGVDTLCKATNLLPENIQVVIIGGEPEQIEAFKKAYPRALFLGFMPYTDIANNQAAADILVLPNTAKNKTSELYTSPLKLFTYMASRKPIVSSDLPSIREVLDDNSCYFVEPDNTEALRDGILHVLEEKEEASKKAERAHALVKGYTWQARAQKILNHINYERL